MKNRYHITHAAKSVDYCGCESLQVDLVAVGPFDATEVLDMLKVGEVVEIRKVEAA